MRAVSVHPDVVVVTSAIWQTTCTVVSGGEEAFVIDSPVLPEELSALPRLVEEAGFTFAGLLATHADWDHLLGRLAFPDASLGCAATTAQRLAADPAAPGAEMRAFDDSHYVVRAAELALDGVQVLPVPGRCEVGARELELHPAPGHTSDGMAVWAGWAGVLVCGDYVSPVEIPTISADGSLDAYRATLERLGPLVHRAEWVVPGHGGPVPAARAAALLEEDMEYLEGLGIQGEAPALPAGRDSPEQRRIHAQNLAALRGGSA